MPEWYTNSSIFILFILKIISGTYAKGNECLQCSLGSVSSVGSTNCTPCTPGYYSSSRNSSICQPCSGSTIAPNKGSAVCTACALSSIANANKTFCSQCPNGNFTIILLLLTNYCIQVLMQKIMNAWHVQVDISTMLGAYVHFVFQVNFHLTTIPPHANFVLLV